MSTAAVSVALLAAVLALPVRAADPVPYRTELKPTGNGAMDTALRGSSSLLTLQKTQAVSPFALTGRARADVDRLQTVLQSFGYYAGTVRITVQNRPVTDTDLPDVLGALPKGQPAQITIAVTPGPLFHLGSIAVHLPPGESLDPADRAAMDLREGQPAVASDVLGAQGRLLTALENQGHAFAAVQVPKAYLHPDSRTLDVVFDAKEGPRLDIGAITLEGLKHVNASYVRQELLIHPGQLYQPDKIEQARQDLASTGVFSDVAVNAAPSQAADGRLPLVFTFQEAKRHSLAAQIGYSTDLGGSAGVTWTDYNLFGNAEKLELAALVTGLGGTAYNGLGYDVYADLLRPLFLRRNQTLDLRIEGIKQNLQAYDQTALLVRAVINRKISRYWSVSGGVGGEQERIRQEGVSRSYTLGFVPLSATYDGTDLSNPLDEPTHGIRATLSATPTVSFGSGSGDGGGTNKGGNSFFAILQGTGSTYLDLARIGLTRPGRSIIALRATVGSVQGASTFELPPDQRLYAGGSGTVRGYKYQGVGPQFADGYPVGGTAVDAGTVEFRQRIGSKYGAAAFVDAGQVSSGSTPFNGTLRVGAGVGARYYTSIGPIRLDVAVPLDKQPHGDDFELYVGLGSSF